MKHAIFLLLVAGTAPAQAPRPYLERCAHCHGADAHGGERGPDLSNRGLDGRSAESLSALILEGLPQRGMPPTRLRDAEVAQVVAFLKTLKPAETDTPAIEVYGPSFAEVAAPKPGDWLSYHGVPGGNRYSPLDRIHTGNVGRLAVRWLFPIPGSTRLQVTPVVAGGVMYVTYANECHALDARNGRRLWSYRRPRTKGLAGDAASGINRGVAMLEGRVFLVTDNAHLLALDRSNGKLLWDIEMADSRQNYGATSAPLVVKDLVVSGTSGGDEGARGFIAAYRASTGERVWRFWTAPLPGDPAAETWQGKAIEHGCSTAWLTGTYDPALDLLYWPTGNPCPDYNGDERLGDNLYSDSVVALDPATGKLKWHFQFTPHDLHDWDAEQTPMLVNARFRGRERKLLMQASRNGFFYVLDRTNGEFLLGKPFVSKLTWASGIDERGRPVLLPGADPTPEGARACPAVEGATNWFSTAFHPGTGLFYVQALEKCDIYVKSPAVWEAGKSYYGGDTRNVPGERGRKYLRALDPETGRIVWEYPQNGPANSWGGVLATAGGLVFVGDDNGDFAAVDAKSGRPLWRFAANQLWKASPMTYSVDGRQYVAIAAGSNIVTFALP